MAGIQAQAGVLVIDGSKLSTKAKQRFIDDVIKELSGIGAGLPCGPTVSPVNSAALQRLHNEEEFPEFHNNWLGPNGAYTKVAQALDVKGAHFGAPLFDPFALFNIPGIPSFPPKIDWKPPELLDLVIQFKPDFTLPKIKAALPPNPNLPLPLPIPTFDIDPRFTALIDFNLNFVLQIIEVVLPKLIADFAVKVPNIIANIAVELPKLACGALDGVIAADPRFITQIVAVKVLANKIGECLEFDAVGLVLGCPDPDIVGGPGHGLVGALATSKGLGVEAKEDVVVQEANKKKQDVIKEIKELRDTVEDLISDNVPAGYNTQEDPNQEKFQDITDLTLKQLKSDDIFISTCGFLPHWLLHRLGCRQKEIINRDDESAGLKYEDGKNLSKLKYGAQKLGAWIPYNPSKTPKKGDIVLIQIDALVNGTDPTLKQGSDGTNVGETPKDYTSQHVFVFLEETDTSTSTEKKSIWRSADAGQGGVGTQSARIVFREKKGRKLKADGGLSRDIVGWVDISKLKYDSAPIL